MFGLGYVGSVTAACLAQLGHRVTGVDKDEFKVRQIQRGEAPFHEPGLGGLIAAQVGAGRLSASGSAAEALAGADVAMICVGTPSARNGNLSLDQLERVAEEIAGCARNRAEPLTVAVRSTVFPGTGDRLLSEHFRGCPAVSLVANPEFLREGNAVQDFLEPALVVVGGSPPEAAERVAALYAPLGVAPLVVSLPTAEMIKYACNAFHAVKIAFANELSTLCQKLEVSGEDVLEALCRDRKLNLSAAYLKPGFAFGGSCLPKDLRALTYQSMRLDLTLPLLEAVLPSNERHLRRAIQAVLDLPPSRIGIFGLAFKEDTDDLRESPAVALVEHLIGKGLDLVVYDPYIRFNEIYGSNRNFLMNAVPHIRRLLVDGLEEFLSSCERLVLVRTPPPAAAERIAGCGLPVLDLTRPAPPHRPGAAWRTGC